jgi:hypothetical protein
MACFWNTWFLKFSLILRATKGSISLIWIKIYDFLLFFTVSNTSFYPTTKFPRVERLKLLQISSQTELERRFSTYFGQIILSAYHISGSKFTLLLFDVSSWLGKTYRLSILVGIFVLGKHICQSIIANSQTAAVITTTV